MIYLFNFFYMSSTCLAPPVAQVVKILQANEGDIRDSGFDPWVRKAPWSRKWQPTPVFWPVNPMDRGAWWATGHRVTKSQTRLKRLSTGVCLPVQEHIVTIHGRIFMRLLEYCVCVCAPSLRHVWLFATPWSVDCQALCPWNFLTIILEQVAIFCSRGSSWSRDQTHISCVSCVGR